MTTIRVRGTVTFTGEWFVELDEHVDSPADAIAVVASGASFMGPENVLVDHVFISTEEPVYCDDDGEPLPPVEPEPAAFYCEACRTWSPLDGNTQEVALREHLDELHD